jgi:pimeloyl-ACP methyl ester carboxylesterase
VDIVQRGAGPPLLLLPGIQGRWEYLFSTVDALAESFRVITFPLSGERGAPPFQPDRGFDNYADQAVAVLDTLGIERAVVCGVSFGGLAALRLAARHPDRVLALILVSTPGPGWRPQRRHAIYARLPYLLGPLFIVETPWRVWGEIRSAIPDASRRWRFVWRQLRTLAAAPLSMRRMAARGRLIASYEASEDCARVSAPTLVISGDVRLDRVVPVEGTTLYSRLIRGAVAAQLDRTGHLGLITQPRAFASMVKRFVDESRHAAA